MGRHSIYANENAVTSPKMRKLCANAILNSCLGSQKISNFDLSAAPEEVNFEATEVDEETNEVRLSCGVTGVFPEPEVNVTVTWKTENGR